MPWKKHPKSDAETKRPEVYADGSSTIWGGMQRVYETVDTGWMQYTVERTIDAGGRIVEEHEVSNRPSD